MHKVNTIRLNDAMFLPIFPYEYKSDIYFE